MSAAERGWTWFEHAWSRLSARVVPSVIALRERLGDWLQEWARRRRWWRVIERSAWQLGEDNVFLLAAGVAFYVFLSIPALISGLISLYGLGFDPSDVEAQIRRLQGLVPDSALSVLQSQFQRIASSSNRTLGIGLALSVFVAVWGARVAMLSLIAALNQAFGARETRSFIAVQGVALALALYVILFAVCAVILLVIVPVVLTVLPLGPLEKSVASLMQWVLLVGLVFSLLAAFYRFAPDNRARCRWFSAGAMLAAALWLVASWGFSIYAEASASYNQTYGSIGGIVVLLTWLYLSFFVVLLGAEVNAAIAADRTGTERPAADDPEGSPPPSERASR